ncbi:uncharacterized protein RJT21DRAFT_131556 [Scheffersomyces amazonensis]|uniref:uncharacterized protein n=1 Tax=Scheffersomyces amazonensis TaxID=1078765 RepID=UPI00315C7E20
MPPKSKPTTPVVEDPIDEKYVLKFPAFSDQVQTLQKLGPLILANQASEQYSSPELIQLRNSYKYIYVVNWLYHCRGFVRLQSEYFDVDVFELELLNYFPIVNSGYEQDGAVKDGQLFIQKLKLNLISTLQNSKLSSLNNFETIFKLWFGSQTPLGGSDEDDDEQGPVEGQEGELPVQKKQQEVETKFDELSIADKFEIIYILISTISSYSKFRDWIDKNNLSVDNLRLVPIYTHPVGSTGSEDYLLLFDNTRLYKRIIHYHALVVPKKRKLSPVDPNVTFKPSQFDVEISDIQFELVYKNVYEYNSFVKGLKLKKLKPVLVRPEVVESVLGSEIKKRRYLTNKKKEVQLLSLLSTRKRSLRLEIKEKQKHEELEKQRLQEEYELKLAAQKRSERRTRSTDTSGYVQRDYGHGLSRDERLKLRRVGTPVFTPTPEVREVEEVKEVNGEEPVVVESEVKSEVVDVVSEDEVEDEEVTEGVSVVESEAKPEIVDVVSEDEAERVEGKVTANGHSEPVTEVPETSV